MDSLFNPGLRHAAIIALLLAACGTSPSPEKAGENLARQQCECEMKREEFRVDAMKQMLRVLKKGDITDERSLMRKMEDIKRGIDEQEKTCTEKADALFDEYHTTFARNEDRSTMVNSRMMHNQKCAEALERVRTENRARIAEMQAEMNEVGRKLGL